MQLDAVFLFVKAIGQLTVAFLTVIKKLNISSFSMVFVYIKLIYYPFEEEKLFFQHFKGGIWKLKVYAQKKV